MTYSESMQKKRVVLCWKMTICNDHVVSIYIASCSARLADYSLITVIDHGTYARIFSFTQLNGTPAVAGTHFWSGHRTTIVLKMCELNSEPFG